MKRINSVKLKGNNNVVIQGVTENGQVTISEVKWDDFVQKYTIEQRERIKELQLLLSRTDKLYDLKALELSGRIDELQADLEQKEEQIKFLFKELEDKDLSRTSDLYQLAATSFIEGELDRALVLLDEGRLDEQERNQAEERVLKARIYRLKNQFDQAEFQLKWAVSIYPSFINCHELADFYRFLNKTNESIYYFQKCLEASDTDHDTAIVLNSLGNLTKNQNAFNEAKHYFKEALSYYEALSNKSAIYMYELAVVLGNIAILYRLLHEFRECELNLEKSNSILEKLSKEDGQEYLPDVARNLHNLGNLYMSMEQYAKSEAKYFQALEIRRKISENDPDKYLPELASTLNNLGSILGQQEKLDQGIKYQKEALQIRKDLVEKNSYSHLPEYANSVHNLATVYLQMNKPEFSLNYFLEALNIYKNLSKAYPQVYLFYFIGTSINLASLYQTGILNKEKSLAYLDQALSNLVSMLHLPNFKNHVQTASYILLDWGIDPRQYISEFIDRNITS